MLVGLIVRLGFASLTSRCFGRAILDTIQAYSHEGGMKVLIVDDSLTARMVLRKEVESIPGIEILEANCGNEGMQKAKKHLPQVITMDINMPDMDGIEATAQIRNLPECHDIPVVIITGHAGETFSQRAFAAGAAEFMVKPFPSGRLRDYVAELAVKQQALSDMTVLVVDDAMIVRTLVTRILISQGAKVITAFNGLDAIQKMIQNEIHLIVTDYTMPRLGGIGLCEYVRNNKQRYDIPIIMLTAREEPDVVLEVLRAGADDYLTKPFSREELLARINNHARSIRFNWQLQGELEERTRREQKILQELDQARVTQQVLLPKSLPEFPQITLAAKYQPMDQIGGDFYNVFPLESNKCGLMVADVTGHGVSAALISFMVSGLFRNHQNSSDSSAKVIGLTNQALVGNLPLGNFVTVFYGVYDLENKTITYTTAGHPPALVIRPASQEVFSIKSNGIVVGVMPSAVAEFEEKTFHFCPGDKLLVYTDGIIELQNKEGEMLKMQGLTDFLQEHAHLPIQALLDALFDFGKVYSNREGFNDDITMVGLEVGA